MNARIQKFINSSLFWYVAVPGVLLLITAIAYAFSLNYEFQFDDEPNILKFYDIRFLTLGDLFFTGTRWIGRWLSVLCYALGGFQPFVYRCVNVLIHLLTGSLVYYFLLEGLRGLREQNFFSTYRQPLAALTAGMFLLHPVQTQTVSYIVQGQLEGLSGLFVMAMVLTFLFIGRKKELNRQIPLLGLLYILGFFACGTKEIAIVSPFLVLLTDWFFIAQGSWQDLKRRWWMHALLFVEVFSIYVWFMGRNYFIQALGLQMEAHNLPGNCLTAHAGEKIQPYTFAISQFKVILHYLFMFIWPSISMEYDWRLETSIDSLSCLLPFLTLMGIFMWIGARIRSDKTSGVAFGLLWFFICMAPRSSIIPAWELLVDYKTYLASVGWLFVLSAGLIYLYSKLTAQYQSFKKPAAPLIAFGSFVLLLALLTVWQNRVWESGYAFWHHILQHAPGKARVQNNFGCQLLNKRNYKQALPYFKRAIKLEQNYDDPYTNLAFAYGALDKVDLAIMALRDGLKVNPYQPKAYNNMSRYMLQKKEYDWAVKAAEQAIALVPHYGKAYYNMGQAYLAQGDEQRAWESFKVCCTASDFSESPDALQKYAQTSMNLRQLPDVIYALERLVMQEATPDRLFNLGNAYYQSGKFQQAEKAWRGALQATPTDFKIIRNLTEVVLAQGRAQEALDLMRDIESNYGDFDGLAIEKARALKLLGKNNLAYYTLMEFKNKYPTSQFMLLADQLMQEL